MKILMSLFWCWLRCLNFWRWLWCRFSLGWFWSRFFRSISLWCW